jgi:hypothetical protein
MFLIALQQRRDQGVSQPSRSRLGCVQTTVVGGNQDRSAQNAHQGTRRRPHRAQHSRSVVVACAQWCNGVADRSSEEERAHYISKQDVRNIAQRLEMVAMEGPDEIYQDQNIYLQEMESMEGVSHATEEVTITTEVAEMVPDAVAEEQVMDEYHEENFDVQVVDDMPGAVLAEQVLDIEELDETDQLTGILQAIRAKAQVIISYRSHVVNLYSTTTCRRSPSKRRN